MLIIPAIDIKKDRIVRLHKGDFNKVSEYLLKPGDVFKDYLAAGIKRLHLIFLWGALSGNIEPVEEDVVKNIVEIRKTLGKDFCKIQAGGGMRTYEKIDRFLQQGIDYIIVGTAFLIPVAMEEGFSKGDIKLFYQQGGKHFIEEKEIPEFELIDRIDSSIKDRIIVSIDYRQEETALSGWQVTLPLTPHYLIGKFMERGFNRFIITNVEKDGTLEGTDAESVERIIDRIRFAGYTPKELLVAGGITSESDISLLGQLKNRPDGVVIGKALYQNRLNLKQTIKDFQTEKNL